jgi:superoxide dismutase, Fe-Mn family
MNRNIFLKSIFVGVLGAKLSPTVANNKINVEDPFLLPKLGFDYKALEPHIDAMTMEIHHSKHHQAYINNLNKAVVGTANEKTSLEDLLKTISKQSPVIRNNGGGHWNHTFFWEILSPTKGKMSDKLTAMVVKDFGSVEKMQTEFTTAATSRFGSGWAWLVVQDGKLKICSTPNQDNPLMDDAPVKGTPILALDVWEHAYYLKYQNKRADYIKAFWNVINWESVDAKLKKAI